MEKFKETRFQFSQKSESLVEITYGNPGPVAGKLSFGFTAELTFDATGAQTSASFRFTNWITGDGVAKDTKEMQKLMDAVKAAFLAQDPNAKISTAG
jgi:hypothetical protein